MKNQKTLRQSVSISGIGLHSGKRVTLTLHPARANSGIRFQRTDLPDSREIEANVRNVHSTTLATTLSAGNSKISTVEHLMSALWAMGIDNALCAVDGEELPILDGSAAPFVQLIRKAGVKKQRSARRFLVALKPIEIRSGDNFYTVDVKLSTSFSSLSYVYVVNDMFREELKTLQQDLE